MKRLACILLILLFLFGCGPRTVSPSTEHQGVVAVRSTLSPSPMDTPMPESPSPSPASIETPAPVLPTFAPKADGEPLFAEELLSWDGEPIQSKVWALLSMEEVSKETFRKGFTDVVRQIKELDDGLRALEDKSRTVTADRQQATIDALTQLIGDKTLMELDAAYQKCPGEGEPLPLAEYSAAIKQLLQDLESMEVRTAPFYSLDRNGAGDFRTVLSRYIGEKVDPQAVLNALEELAQTEAYALAAALRADPEVARKKESISFGGFSQDLTYLRDFTQEFCPLPDGSSLTIPNDIGAEREMDLLELAFRYYPGMAFLKAYADRSGPEQQARWENAPDGYLAGVAVHASYAVIHSLEEFELEYVQYKWYEDMLYVTLTGISSLLIHYYGYSQEDLSAYLESWGASSYTEYLYEKAMFDPFESLVASYGYYQYLDICQAALDAGCENERRFFRDYLAVGPAPFRELKEYMVDLYQKQG